jgi:hypothetical protein
VTCVRALNSRRERPSRSGTETSDQRVITPPRTVTSAPIVPFLLFFSLYAPIRVVFIRRSTRHRLGSVISRRPYTS